MRITTLFDSSTQEPDILTAATILKMGDVELVVMAAAVAAAETASYTGMKEDITTTIGDMDIPVVVPSTSMFIILVIHIVQLVLSNGTSTIVKAATTQSTEPINGSTGQTQVIKSVKITVPIAIGTTPIGDSI